MRGFAIVVVLLSGACGPILGIDDLTLRLDGGIDSGPDANVIDAGPDALTCTSWDAVAVDSCAQDLPAATPLALIAGTSYQLDTDTGILMIAGGSTVAVAATPLAQTLGPEVLALNLASFDMASTASLVVRGSRPLAVIVHGDAMIDGLIDLDASSSGGPSQSGPGGDLAATCDTGPGPGNAATGPGGGGGGGGGGYGGNGGDGGDGNGSGNGAKGAKGSETDTATIPSLRGGCTGAVGGPNVGGVLGGAAGAGGGAVAITALGTLTINGIIRTRGDAGRAPSGGNAGGGGGGSGGAILLDAADAIVSSTASLCANGGGGGEGGAITGTSLAAQPGTCSETVRALGGSGTDGGNGGNGGYFVGLTGTNATNGANGAGGGGGGGGVGRIRVRGRESRAVDGAATITPDAAP